MIKPVMCALALLFFAASGASARDRVTRLAPHTMLSWREGEHGARTVVQSGGLTLTLEGRSHRTMRDTVLTLRSADGGIARFVGEGGLSEATAHLGVGRVDAAGDPDQVVFTTYSGGAHCCVRISLIERLHGRWIRVSLGEQDGSDIAFPTDLAGVGRRQFLMGDDRFLYQFGSFAESLAPPVLKEVRNGHVIDVSSDPRLRPVFARQARTIEADCRRRINGACAAFVAAAARAGQFDRAWRIMLAHYNSQPGYTLDEACRVDVGRGVCPEGKKVRFKDFPQALRWFLGMTGYLPSTPLPTLDAA